MTDGDDRLNFFDEALAGSLAGSPSALIITMTADSVTAGWLLRGSRIAQIINATITFIFDTNFEGDFRAILGRF